ncbi:TetR/AcrR family transcriptional regulator C-terminal domain-containing protein [soil metagenome]
MAESTVRSALTPERIVRAAVDVVDQEGLDALTMRRLGAEVGFEAMSLYRHFESKAALLDAVLADLLGQLELPALGADWRADLREGCRRYRRLLLEHPNAVSLFARLELGNPSAVRAAGWVMAVLRGAGRDAETALQVLSTLQSYVIGFAFWEVGTAPLRADPRFAGPRRPVQLPRDADPYLAALLPQFAGTSCDESFEFGLDVMIRGIDRGAAEESPASVATPG